VRTLMLRALMWACIVGFVLCAILAIAAHAQVTYPATTTRAPQYSWTYYTKPGTSFQLGGSTPATTPAGVPQIPCQTPSGGVLTTPGSCLPGINGRAVTGTTSTDTIVSTDCNPYRIEYTGSVAVAITLPTAITLGVPNCSFKLVNALSTVHDLTVTSTTWNCNGVPTCVIHQGQTAVFFVDPLGTYWAVDIVGQGSVTFSILPTATNGTLLFCTDCKNVTDDTTGTFDSVAASGGHGTNVLRENGAWRVH